MTDSEVSTSTLRSGIGFGIARRFADEGAKGVIIGRNQKTLDAAGKALGGAFLPLQCDVTLIANLESAFQTVADQFGGIDVLVVNADGGVLNL